ncbi:TPA: YopX family protein [Streptococcus suis]
MIPKFRAYNPATNDWYKPEEVFVSDGNIYLDDDDFDDLTQNNDVTLMQSTGLFDVNGKEIFEGDVICVNYTDDDSPWTDTVIWSLKDCAWYLKSNKELLGFAIDEPNIIVEIIGNVWEGGNQ